MSIRENPEANQRILKLVAQFQKTLELESELCYKEGYIAGLEAAQKIFKGEEEEDNN